MEQEAAAWVAKLDGGALSRKELRGLREWSLRSLEHRAAINEMAAHWDRLDVLRLLRPAGDVSRGFGRRWRRAGAALAAGLAVVAVTLGTLRILPGELPDAVAPAGTTYLTAIGELQSVTLPDGTHVHINTNSRLQVDYSEEKRGVLLHLGEAYFEVANSDRPFVVSAGNGQITALGTAFAVRVTEDNVVDVDVTEGMVVITAGLEFATTGAGSSALTSRVASAGQVVRVGETIELVRTVEPARLERELAWRDGMLVFDGDTLEHDHCGGQPLFVGGDRDSRPIAERSESRRLFSRGRHPGAPEHTLNGLRHRCRAGTARVGLLASSRALMNR